MVRKSRSLYNFDKALDGLMATNSTSGTRNRNGGTGTPTGSNPSTTPTTSPTNFVGNTSYSDLIKLLSTLGSENGSSLAALLGKMGLSGMQDMSGAQEADYNKQLLDNLFNVLSEQDARNFNLERLKEQRIYDSPTNQLARLMGAGIPRDAAIQMLSGGSGGSGGSLVQGQAAQMAEGLPATQSDLNKMQTGLMPINTVFGAISAISSAISGLGNFGISAASLSTLLSAQRAATAGQLLQNTQLSKTLQGIETASTVISALSQAYDAGIIDSDTTFKSAQDMLGFIRKNADAFQPFNDLVATGALDNINRDVYSLNALNHGYKSWRESRDYNLDRKHITRMYALDELGKSIDIAEVNSAIALNQQRINESIANVLNQNKLTDSTLNLQSMQAIAAASSAGLADAQADAVRQQIEMTQPDLDWLNANIDDINAIRTTQIQLEVAEWNKLTPQELEKEAKAWLQDRQNKRSIIAIESYYYGNQLQAAEERNDPNKPAFSDQSFADWIVYMHNLFTSALPNSPKASASFDDKLGSALGQSAVARHLLKAVKVPL